jgi:peptidyl-prolyl cis-trans isomerase D
VIQTKTEADAKAVLDELKKGADFATLAKEKSTDIISARNGGDMGWLEDAATVPELKDAGLKEKGQLSGVIKSSVGSWLPSGRRSAGRLNRWLTFATILRRK